MRWVSIFELKRRWIPVFIGFFIFWGGILQASSGQAEAGETISDTIRSVFKDDSLSHPALSRCLRPESVSTLIRYYESRSWTPYWVDENGPTLLGKDLMQSIELSWSHGLIPRDYHLALLMQYGSQVQEMIAQGRNAAQLLGVMDVLMMDAFFRFSTHLLEGKVRPQRFDPHWISPKHKSDIIEMLNVLAARRNIQDVIRKLAPPHDDYWNLMDASVRLNSVVDAGGWPIIEEGGMMRLGDVGARVDLLRSRLTLSQDFETQTEDDAPFGQILESAVRRFQARHGLKVDGVVGPETLAALNVPADQRLRQLQLNMERWRWLPHQWQDCRIVVNIAAFTLKGYRGDHKQIEMPVIVGKSYQMTPVFSEKMRYLVINPYWNVPRAITVTELLPILRKDPDYLVRNHFEVVAGWESPVRIIDSTQLDWENVRADNLPGRIRQLPGAWNALGRIKFMFPNRFHVYLHDTPDRHLFSNPKRALSHGCIRVERPMDLAMFVLQDDPAWSPDRLLELIESGERKEVRLNQACTVYLLYWTAWIDENGELNFRDDIYTRDKPLWDALNQNSGEHIDSKDCTLTRSSPVRYPDE